MTRLPRAGSHLNFEHYLRRHIGTLWTWHSRVHVQFSQTIQLTLHYASQQHTNLLPILRLNNLILTTHQKRLLGSSPQPRPFQIPHHPHNNHNLPGPTALKPNRLSLLLARDSQRNRRSHPKHHRLVPARHQRVRRASRRHQLVRLF